MTAMKKALLLNTVLLLVSAALLFRGYLPVTEEITALNQELKGFEGQIEILKSKAQPQDKLASKSERKLYALPENELEHLSRQLENLATRHDAKLIHFEPETEKTEAISRYKLKLTPYAIGFSVESTESWAELLADLEAQFPEIALQTFHYDKNVGSLDVYVLVSPQGVRLFAS